MTRLAMAHQTDRQRRREPRTPRDAFTLIELLIVIAVIALMVGLLFPALRSVRQSSGLVRELSTARQLMVAYRSYAYENRSMLLPGYYNNDDIGVPQPLPAFDRSGERLDGGAAYRYPWRIAPFLDYNLRGLYLDALLQTRLDSDPNVDSHYLLSVYPSMGINGVFVGGDSEFSGFLADNPNIPQDAIPDVARNFYARRITDVRLPPQLIVFASARVDGQLAVDNSAVTEGFHKLTPPRFRSSGGQPPWPEQYVKDCTNGCDTAAFGHVSLRHAGLAAAVGFFDGHTGTLTYGFDPNSPNGDPGIQDNIRDMRHWAPRANRFDWEVEF